MKASSRCATSLQVMGVSEQLPQPALQLAARVVETAHHRALGTVEDPADLLIREALHLTKKYDGSMFGGQLGNCAAQPPADLARARLLERLVAVRVAPERTAERVPGLERHVGELRLPPPMVDAEVH